MKRKNWGLWLTLDLLGEPWFSLYSSVGHVLAQAARMVFSRATRLVAEVLGPGRMRLPGVRAEHDPAGGAQGLTDGELRWTAGGRQTLDQAGEGRPGAQGSDQRLWCLAGWV